MIKVYPVDIYDKEGNLLRIEFLEKETGEFQFQAQWDERDAQTHENRDVFRKWSNQMAENLGYSF